MSEDNKHIESDDLMRSILSQGQEEVPAFVWEGVSSQLDRIEAAKAGKVHVLWFRRTAIAAAAAAAVVIGVFAGRSNDGDFVPQTSDARLIAVAEKPQVHTDADLKSPSLIAQRNIPYLADASQEVEQALAKAEEATEAFEQKTADSEKKEPQQKTAQQKKDQEYWPEVWEDDETETSRNRRGTSLVLSGVAGTNSAQKNGLSPLRSPSMSTSKPKTGVEQKSSESTYGLPVSLGAGVKFGLSDRWALGVGANYTILTRRFFGTYTLVNSEGTIDTSVSSDIRNVQRYVGIPVNAFYTIVDNEYLNFYTYAGGTVEKCISDKYDVLKTEYVHKPATGGVQLSANVGLGVEFLVSRHLGLYMDPSLRYYFDCGQPKSIRTAQPLMLGIEMGLRVNL